MEEQSSGERCECGVHVCWVTDVGRMRSENQDAVCVVPEKGLLAVSDGMGGEYGGAYASEIVVGRLPVLLEEEMRGLDRTEPGNVQLALGEAVRRLNECVVAESSQMAGSRRMGATLVALVAVEGRAVLAHMGDSRIYRWRDGELQQLTEDHSLVGTMVRSGALTSAQARRHPLRGQILRFVGMGGEATCDLRVEEWRPRDVYLLCSDGLTEVVYADQIEAILREQADLAVACEALVERAKQQRSTDNITVMLTERAEQ